MTFATCSRTGREVLIPEAVFDTVPRSAPAKIQSRGAAGTFVIRENREKDGRYNARERLPDCWVGGEQQRALLEKHPLPDTEPGSDHPFGFRCACCNAVLLRTDLIYRFKSGAVWARGLPPTFCVLGDKIYNNFKKTYFERVGCTACGNSIGALYRTPYTDASDDHDPHKPFPCMKLVAHREVNGLLPDTLPALKHAHYMFPDVESEAEMLAGLQQLDRKLNSDYRPPLVGREAFDAHHEYRRATIARQESADPHDEASPFGDIDSLPRVSLRMALRDLAVKDPAVDAAARTAELFATQWLARRPADSRLTVDEVASLRLYTMQEFFGKFNQALRGRLIDLPLYRSYLALLFDAFAKLPPSGPVTLYRGVADKARSYEPGNREVWWGLTSCSKSLGVAQGFGPAVIFRIKAINGKDLSPFSAFVSEQELALVPGTTLMVTGSQQERGITMVDVTEAPASPARPVARAASARASASPLDARLAALGF